MGNIKAKNLVGIQKGLDIQMKKFSQSFTIIIKNSSDSGLLFGTISESVTTYVKRKFKSVGMLLNNCLFQDNLHLSLKDMKLATGWIKATALYVLLG